MEQEEIRELVSRIAAGHLGKKSGQIDPSRPLSSQGAGDLDIAEILMTVEEETNVVLAKYNFSDVSQIDMTISVNDLVDVVVEGLKKQNCISKGSPKKPRRKAWRRGWRGNPAGELSYQSPSNTKMLRGSPGVGKRLPKSSGPLLWGLEPQVDTTHPTSPCPLATK